MQQRQLRLGDVLDDYCPRERRVTNHVVVAMIEAEVKQTRCTTCDAEHEYKHAKVPRQRRKAPGAAVLAVPQADGSPKRVVPDPSQPPEDDTVDRMPPPGNDSASQPPDRSAQSLAAVDQQRPADVEAPADPEDAEEIEPEHDFEQGPAHRRLIRATLPRLEGQPPPTRPAPEFTIRQPTGRQGRFRPRQQQRGPSPFHTGQNNGNRSGNMGGGAGQRQGGGAPPMSRAGKRHGGPGPGRKRSK
jgi:hypothetical protein